MNCSNEDAIRFCDETPIEFCVEEKGTRRYTATLRDQDDQPVPGASITSIRMRLIDEADEFNAAPTYLNTRDGGAGTKGNVHNQNGGTFHPTSGQFTMLFESADFPIADVTQRIERKIIIFEFAYTGGVKRRRLTAIVENLPAVS